MDCIPPRKPYLPLRFTNRREFSLYSLYYAYGNTPAEDFLEHVRQESVANPPSVLSLGCGDIRSCIYTMWKHFYPSVSRTGFNGVTFVLNDISAAVLARNVLFLYLIVNNVSFSEERLKRFISSLWAIWYCHDLLPAHVETLNEGLGALLQCSDSLESWNKLSDRKLWQIIEFTDENTLKQIRAVWKLWSTKSFGTSQKMKEKKKNLRIQEKEGVITFSMKTLMPKIMQYFSQEVLSAMRNDNDHYLEDGNAFAEEVMTFTTMSEGKMVNPTFFEQEDGVYSLHPDSIPYDCFNHGFLWTKSNLQDFGGSDSTKTFWPLVVSEKNFKKRPLLSNSVQQFGMWVSSATQILTTPKNIKFIFNCSDCIQFCENLHCGHVYLPKRLLFDAIYTSNLIDFLNPAVILYAAMPLLKSTGICLSTTLVYKSVAESIERFLHSLFGFNPELLPIIGGFRAIGYDGIFSDTTSVNPLLTSIGEIVLNKASPRTLLIWERITNSDPLVLKALEEDSSICCALYDAFFTVAQNLLQSSLGVKQSPNVKEICIETAIATILRFTSCLSRSVEVGSYVFWDSLCSLLKDDPNVCSLLVHIQTQALLHGLHFHLTLVETNCPICLRKPIEEHISCFSVKFDPMEDMKILPNVYTDTVSGASSFLVFVHKHELVEFSISDLDPNTHVIDSAQGQELPGGRLMLDFYAPNEFVVDGYSFSVVKYLDLSIEKCIYSVASIPVASLTGKLDQVITLLRYGVYHLKQVEHCGAAAVSNFGSIVSHFGDADEIATVVTLSSSTISAMKTDKIMADQRSLGTLSLWCGHHSLNVNYPFPVASPKLKVYRSKGRVEIAAKRDHYHFYNELPLFFVNPSNKILQSKSINEDVLAKLSGLQCTKEEVDSSERKIPLPYYTAKVEISCLFQFKSNYILYRPASSTCIWGSVVIHRRAFDTEKCTPAVDIWYTDFETVQTQSKSFNEFIEKWFEMGEEIQSSQNIAERLLIEDQWKYLLKVFNYFTNRTLKTASSGSSPILEKYGLTPYYTRAVLYMLYNSPDHLWVPGNKMASNPTSLFSNWFPASQVDMNADNRPTHSDFRATASPYTPTEDHTCSYCLTMKPKKLKKCTGCGLVQYCGKECQTKHWDKHKPQCKPQESRAKKSFVKPVITKCSNCEKCNLSLKHCACHSVAYCCKECQRNDWIKHRSNCSASHSK